MTTTPTLREAAQQALEALDTCNGGDYSTGSVVHPSFDETAVEAAITALSAALAEQAAEQAVPVAEVRGLLLGGDGMTWWATPVPGAPTLPEGSKLYATPPAPARQEWQPIETAPKTGAKIIVRYVNRNNKPRTVMARWLTDEQAEETDADGVGLKGGWYECIDNWDDYTEVAIHEGEPSLWQPLPAAPIPAAPAEGEKR